MKSWQVDKCWADKFIPEITKILTQNAGAFLDVAIANDQDDMEKATDLVVTVTSGQVAVRIRRDGYKKKYRDWTIRSYRNSGSKTELEKLRDGFGRWYLYLWTNNLMIVDWILIDLNRARESGLLFKKRHHIQNKNKNGGPDGTYFVAISIPEIKNHGCLVNEFQPLLKDYQVPLFKVY